MATPERPAVQRPLSPHLQVYKPQLTSMMSIAHRATGVANAIAAFGLAWWLVAVAAGPEAYATFVACAGSVFGRLVLMAVTATLVYHLCNGIRHLLWDAGKGLEIDAAYRSGYAVLGVSLVLTVGLWVVVLGGVA
jgi:succinate dehydrogenase / fumarate reductase, cytochrome b subunit